MKTWVLIAIATAAVVIVVAFLLYKQYCSEPQTISKHTEEVPPEPLPQKQQKSAHEIPALVLFASESCIHCKKLMPTWAELMKQVKRPGVLNVIEFTKEKNPQEFQGKSLPGVPTIRFYPDGYGNDVYVEYNGDRSLESLVKFVRSGGIQ